MTAAVPRSMFGHAAVRIAHQLEVVGDERVVAKVMFGRPQTVEAKIGGEPREADFLIPHTLVGIIVPAIAREHHHHADIHRPPRRFALWH